MDKFFRVALVGSWVKLHLGEVITFFVLIGYVRPGWTVLAAMNVDPLGGSSSNFRPRTATNEIETRIYFLPLPSYCLKEGCAA